MAKKISMDGGRPLDNPLWSGADFGAAFAETMASAGAAPPVARSGTPGAAVRRGAAHLRMERAGRGGKTVTVIFGPGIAALDAMERADLLRSLKRTLGVGGAVAAGGGELEVQGDERPRAAAWLRGAGFSCKG